ncbi:MAG: hypothetical protein OHK0022_08370 [Roseiflexaceae bacterium]
MEFFAMGMIAMGFGVAGMFFLRFWKDTRDQLFAIFALAFFVFSLNRLGLAVIGQSNEAFTSLYVIRLIGFLFILVAIINKNRSAG